MLGAKGRHSHEKSGHLGSRGRRHHDLGALHALASPEARQGLAVMLELTKAVGKLGEIPEEAGAVT